MVACLDWTTSCAALRSNLYMEWDLVRVEDVETCHAPGVTVGTLEGWHNSFYSLVHDLGIDFVLADRPEVCRGKLGDVRATLEAPDHGPTGEAGTP